MINNEIVSYIKVSKGQGLAQEEIEKNLLSGGWNASDISEAFAVINTANVSGAPVSPTYSNIPASTSNPVLKSKHHHLAKVFGVVVLIAAIAGGVYAYTGGVNPFSKKILYSEENLFSGILEKTASINTSSYSASGSLSVVPREAGAKPFVLDVTEDEVVKKQYENDVKRSRDISGIMGALRYSSYDATYPSTLQKLKEDDFGYNDFSTNDPLTSQPYGYTVTNGGKGYTLKVVFETQDAITQIRRGYEFDETKTLIDGRLVTFTETSDSYFYLSSTLPKPLLVELGEMAEYLPNEFKMDGTVSAKTDWQTESISDWVFNIDANGDFGDLQYKVNIDALKKDKDYYFKINNIPSIFLGKMSDAKGVWIKVSPKDENESGYSDYNDLAFFANEFLDSEESYKETRAETTHLLNMAAKFADEEKLFSFKNKPSAEKVDGETLYRYELQFNKPSILPFYQKLLAEARTTQNKYELFEDEGMVAYLQSKEFDAVFDYYQNNTSLILWTDKAGFPAILEYKLRLVPPDNAEQLKDKQADLVFKIKISDINKPIIIEAPADAKNIDEVGGSPLGEARIKGANAAIKANLSSIRASAELYYDENSNSYGKLSLTGSCDATEGTLFSDDLINKSIVAVKDIIKNETGSSVLCYGSPVAWAVSASLIDTDTDTETGYWCVDSTGASKLSKTAASTVYCPE